MDADRSATGTPEHPLSPQRASRARRGAARAWSLKQHFLFFGLVLVVPLAVLASALIVEVSSTNRRELEQRTIQVARSVAADVDRELQRRITILQTLAYSPALTRKDLETFQNHALSALGDGWTVILLLEPASLRQLVNTFRPFGSDLPQYGAPETARRALAAGTWQISDFFIGRVSQRPAFDIVYPVVRGGETQYLIVMGLEPPLLQSILQGQQLPAEWIINIADRNGVVLARSSGLTRVGTKLPAEFAAQPAHSVATVRSLEGNTVLRATATSQLSGWQIAVNSPLAAAEAPLRRNVALLVLWAMVALLATALLAAFFARIVSGPITAAAHAAAGLADGEAVPETRSRVAEANKLMGALHYAAERLSTAEETRKEAEERQHLVQQREKLLAEELQHRTKNLFAVVQALAARTLRGDGRIEQARADFLGRLNALARADRRLMRSSWAGTSLRDLIFSELEPFADRIKVEGADVMLDARKAQNFALAIHELGTNAAKHGALSKPGGEVAVAWTVSGSGAGAALAFRWRERGGPAVIPPAGKGFGTALLQFTLGQGRVEYAPEGLSYEVHIPLNGTDAAREAALEA